MKRLLTLISLITIIAMIAGCGETPEEKRQNLTNDAFRAAHEYKFDKAADLFRQLAELDPQSPMSYYGRGLIMENQQQLYDALHVYMTISNTSPDFVDAWAGLWRVFTKLEMYQDASNAASEYVKRAKEDPQSHLCLAKSMLRLGVQNRVNALLDSALERGANPNEVKVLQARMFLLEHKRKEADSVFALAMQGNSENAAVFADAARYLEQLDLLDSAVALSRRSVQLSSDDIGRTVDHFRFLIKHHYYFEARQVLASLKAIGVSDIVLAVLQAQYYLERGNMTDAYKAANQIIITAGKTVSARMYEIDIRGADGDELTVSTDVEILVTEMFQNDYDKQFIAFMNYVMAMKTATLLRDPIALPRLETVRPRLQSRMDFQLIRMFLQHTSGRLDDFRKGKETILKYRSGDPAWMTGLADIYGDRLVREFDSAATLYHQVLDSTEFYRPAFEHIVSMYRRLLEFDKAADQFRRYPQYADAYPTLACLRGIVMVEAGQVDSGLAVFLPAAASVSGDYALFDQMHEALRRTWSPDGMRELVDWIDGHALGDPDIEVIGAAVLNDLNDFQAANAMAQEALGKEPSNLDLRAQRARALYGLGETQPGIDILEENLKTNPYNVPSNYWLSRILAEERLEPNRATNLARRAVFDSRSDLTTWMNLVYVYMQVGRYDLARGEASKASHSNMGEPLPLFMLGKAFYLDEKKDDAKENLQAAIDHGLTGPPLQEARTLLKKL